MKRLWTLLLVLAVLTTLSYMDGDDALEAHETHPQDALGAPSLARPVLRLLDGHTAPIEAPGATILAPEPSDTLWDDEAVDEGLDSLEIEKKYFGGGR